jgi:hypothetical protein
MPSETCRNGGANYKNNAYCEVLAAASPAGSDAVVCFTPCPCFAGPVPCVWCPASLSRLFCLALQRTPHCCDPAPLSLPLSTCAGLLPVRALL